MHVMQLMKNNDLEPTLVTNVFIVTSSILFSNLISETDVVYKSASVLHRYPVIKMEMI